MKAGESIHSSAFILLPFSERGLPNLRVVPRETEPSTSLTVSDLLHFADTQRWDTRSVKAKNASSSEEQIGAPESPHWHFWSGKSRSL